MKPATTGQSELNIVRSLADSDLGLFSAHRRGASSRQRAIALTEIAAQQLLAPQVFEDRRGAYDCICLYGDETSREIRLISKSGKNWRLGGRQLSGEAFGRLDSKDFVLIRSVRHNDGSSPILLTFIGRCSERLTQAGLVATLGGPLEQSVAIFGDDAPEFEIFADLFPPVPARVAVRRAELQLDIAQQHG